MVRMPSRTATRSCPKAAVNSDSRSTSSPTCRCRGCSAVAEPGQLLGFEVIAGPARPKGQYILSEAGGSTAVRFVLDLKLPGLMKVLDGLVAKTMQAEVAQLRELKAVVEAR